MTDEIGIGLLQLGVLVNFVSHAVIVGFVSACSITIAVGQVPKLFGIKVHEEYFVMEIIAIFKVLLRLYKKSNRYILFLGNHSWRSELGRFCIWSFFDCFIDFVEIPARNDWQAKLVNWVEKNSKDNFLVSRNNQSCCCGNFNVVHRSSL